MSDPVFGQSEAQEMARFLGAVAFAARAHHGQVRKDGRTPYVSHAFRVCLIVRDLFGVQDRSVLLAALLHDTIEDTTTDFDDLEANFGKEVALWVALLSKDKRLPEPEREAKYAARLASAAWQAKVCKLADIYDNLLDAVHLPPEKRKRTISNARRYLASLKENLPGQAVRPAQMVTELLAGME